MIVDQGLPIRSTDAIDWRCFECLWQNQNANVSDPATLHIFLFDRIYFNGRHSPVRVTDEHVDDPRRNHRNVFSNRTFKLPLCHLLSGNVKFRD